MIIVGITILFCAGGFMQAFADTTDPECHNGDCPSDIPDPGCHNGDCPSGTVAFKLKGLEVFKGIDIGIVRCGTTFLGKLLLYDPSKSQYVEAGYWKSVLCYTGAEYIEVCGGDQNILRFNLEVLIQDGAYAGNKLVLKLADPSADPDVYWNSIAPICGLCISGSDCSCPDSSELIELWDCNTTMPDNSGAVATIPYLELRKGWGTTLDIEVAVIYDGLLCHNWALIPRVAGDLFIFLNE
jgi:hypothetical protein